MRELIILIVLSTVVSAAAYDVPECHKNHRPPSEWPETYPKGMAGWTLFYPLTTDPGPEHFGWDDEDEDFIAMVAIIDAYETWYEGRMAMIADVMDDFSEPMSVTERELAAGEIASLIYDIDVHYMDEGDDCWALVPSEVQENYIDYMEGL